ncbi:MAG TPA: Calx-beta domain-containing protein, partial [Pyrinomonadaceae bacterium]|nr:Calx-beta domain-containing protein [Pyrinomonadaceae bacterium]
GNGSQFNSRSGILLSESSNNLIGGTTAAARNVISGNGFQGIALIGDNNLVQGNFIGTNPAGTAAIPNGIDGIEVSGTNNLIGGTSPGAGNLISGNQRGLTIRGPGNTVQGNLIGTDVTGTKKVGNMTGIDAGAENTLIGGLTPGARNIISGNDFDGVAFGGNGSRLQGNFIGTDITGTLDLGNGGSGVAAGTNALIGGNVPEARNIISGNAVSNGFGNISLGSNTSGPGATVQGNYIGTDVTGTRAIASSFAGISIGGVNHLIGGTGPGEGNVISGNRTGIQIGGFISITLTGNTIQGNLIGLNALGTGQLPNTINGIVFSDASNNTVGGTQAGAGNKIGFNGGTGVVVFSGTGNSIRGNAIFSNGALGIDLGNNTFPQNANGVTPNDPNDPDTGPNNLQNFPVLTSVMSIGNSTTIQGSLNSTPSTAFQIDFYSNAAVDPSGNGEGGQFLGTASVTTDVNGNATINETFPVALGTGRIVTATATDGSGNTSEFSAGDATGATGSVQFSVSSIQVIEDVGLANVTVLRTGGSTGTLTVDFATTDGTAIAGQDYTATSGTLTFNGGETSKTFQIPITDDAPTEPDETFTVTLRNTPSLDMLGAPSTLTITVQDRTTVPGLFLPNAFVTEGGPGTTTDMLFTLNVTAATGRTVSVNFATSNSTAFGGASCSTRGVDYETKSGTFTIQPGTTSLTIPVRICGDTNAEANEFFQITLSNPSNATIIQAGALGTIVNDDVLQLVLEESGPTATQAATLNALLHTRDPFGIIGVPDWWPNSPDKNTRVILFARNLELNPGESPGAVFVRIAGLNTQFFDVPAESVVPIHNFEFTQVVIRLPNDVPVGTRLVTIRAHGRVSNAGTIRVQ